MGEGWPGCLVIRVSIAGQYQLGVAGLYLVGHKAHVPGLWGNRQLYHQASVVAWKGQRVDGVGYGIAGPWRLCELGSLPVSL